MTKPKTKSKTKPAQKHSRWRKLIFIALIVIGLALIAYWIAFWLVQPPRPGKFYNTPDNLPSQPGTLIRSEKVKTDVANADAYRVLYSSRDINDLPIAVSGLVVVPRSTAPEDGFPVVGWAHGTSGIARRCALSLAQESITEFHSVAEALIKEGYIVAATDYPGLGTEGPHPYLIGKSEAQAVLDSIRTVANHPEWDAASQFALWGHSQGGHAALFASHYAGSYAPELDLMGTAAVAPATELTALLRDDIHTPVGKVFGSFALKSWSELFDEAHLDKIVRPADVPYVDLLAKDCLGTKSQGLVILPEVELMSSDFLQHDPTETEPWASIIRDNSVPTDGVGGPVILLQGSDDTVIDPRISQEWAAKFCQHDASLLLKEYAGKDHLSVFPASLPDAVNWIKDRFAGQNPPSTC